MTSMLDAFKEVIGDHLSIAKIGIFAIPVFYSYQVFLVKKTITIDIIWILGVTLFFLLGFLIEVTNNVINEHDTVLPPLNPFKIAYSSIKGIIAIGPSFAISCFIAYYLCSTINTVPWLDNTFKTIIWLVFSSIFTMAFLLFAQRKRILEAYNLKILIEKSGDLIVMLLMYILQLVIMNVITTAFIAYTIFILFGFGLTLNFFLAFAIIFNIAATGHYMAQVHYEALTYDRTK